MHSKFPYSRRVTGAVSGPEAWSCSVTGFLSLTISGVLILDLAIGQIAPLVRAVRGFPTHVLAHPPARLGSLRGPALQLSQPLPERLLAPTVAAGGRGRRGSSSSAFLIPRRALGATLPDETCTL